MIGLICILILSTTLALRETQFTPFLGKFFKWPHYKKCLDYNSNSLHNESDIPLICQMNLHVVFYNIGTESTLTTSDFILKNCKLSVRSNEEILFLYPMALHIDGNISSTRKFGPPTTNDIENIGVEMINNDTVFSIFELWPNWSIMSYSDERMTEMMLFWLEETKISFGVTNLNQIGLPLLISGIPVNESTDNYVLSIKFYLETTCIIENQTIPNTDLHFDVCRLRYGCDNQCRMDCDFEKEEKCNWTWDEDSYKEEKLSSSSKPGQHGFYRCDGKQVGYFHNKLKSKFFGPSTDKSGSSEGSFLYLLGKPLSDADEISDKRLLSALLAESGNQCTVEMTVLYQDIEGAHIIVGIENVDNAYTPYRSFVMGQQNDTTHGSWKTLKVKIGRNISPFRIFIEIRRHKASLSESFIALDKIRLLRCAPEDSGPINCSNSVDPPYTCPGGDGISCLNAPSTLCDLKYDCPRGEDEMEPSCFKMPPAARCNFENFCGWIDPYESTPMQSSKPKSPRWILKSGQTHLEGGIKGDLSGDPHGKYLYYHYKREANTGLPKSVTLMSPPFPPPPNYNSNPGKLYQSCRIRFSYHRQIKGMMPGPIDIFIQWIDDKSKDNGYRKQQAFKVATPSQADKNMGWIRWEAKLPTSPQLRYQIVLSGMGSIGGAEMELAIDDFSLSPHCFGYEVEKSKLEGWRYNMTDLEFCKYYGRKNCPVPKKLPGYVFTTCGMKQGAFGPEKHDCDKFYKSSSTEVKVSGESQIGFTTGIQRWSPPKSGIYTIIAKGASGAIGRLNKIQSSSDEIRAILWLEANETLFILVGQMGQAFCESTGLLSEEGRCDGGQWNNNKRRRRTSSSYDNNNLEASSLEQIREQIRARIEDDVIFHNHSNPNSEKKKKDPFDNIHNDSYGGIGGGGGGGATIIFKIVENVGAIPIIIAAGGGGSSDLRSSIDSDAQGLLDPWAEHHDLQTLVPTVKTDAGSGAGWNETFSPYIDYYEAVEAYKKGNLKKTPHGFSFKNGWFGGLPCSSDEQFGGFGGGGAGCRGGGGGGGFIGGMGGNDNNQNGRGGWSFVNMKEIIMVLDSGSSSSTGGYLSKSKRNWKDFRTWKHIGVGQAQIIPSVLDNPCNCTDTSAACLSLDEEKVNMKCVCMSGIFLSHIHPKCSTDIPILWKLGIVIASLIALAIFGLLSMILYSQFQRKHENMLRRKILSGPDSQLNRLRNMNGNGGGIMLTEYNPNYEFGGGSCSLQDLKEIPRENLRLVKALGQGAFGEVYQGSYKNATDSCEVAVKTLPELSSTQAEMDFLMEALIMSKFNHPNIVYFIGVCFDKHPRYIVLELLAGGDLKTFLRESRPKPDRSSPLVMKDLLTCAMDVAKGCEYLEENHFIHRDIAARNCLLTTKGPSRVVKIADFGMARDIYRADYYRKGGKTMLPVKWMPPEAFLDGIFTSKTDIWSFGILLWEVMSLGYMPYPGRGNQEVMQLVTNGGRLEPPNYCPGPVYGLMCQCWHPIPEERPNFRTILERLGYCMQDPEVVMAPLPMFHRPLSLDSRDTSMSSGRQVDTSLDSGGVGGGFSSFPTRSSTASTTLLNNNKPSNTTTPESPLGPSSPSADYLVPLVSGKKINNNNNNNQMSSRPSYIVNGAAPPGISDDEVRETSFTIMDSSSRSSATPSPPSALDVGALRSQQMSTPKCKYSNVQPSSSSGRSSHANTESISNEISV